MHFIVYTVRIPPPPPPPPYVLLFDRHPSMCPSTESLPRQRSVRGYQRQGGLYLSAAIRRSRPCPWWVCGTTVDWYVIKLCYARDWTVCKWSFTWPYIFMLLADHLVNAIHYVSDYCPSIDVYGVSCICLVKCTILKHVFLLPEGIRFRSFFDISAKYAREWEQFKCMQKIISFSGILDDVWEVVLALHSLILYGYPPTQPTPQPSPPPRW